MFKRRTPASYGAVKHPFLCFSSPQNFFQIISNLLEEENKEKWEDAQQVSGSSQVCVVCGTSHKEMLLVTSHHISAQVQRRSGEQLHWEAVWRVCDPGRCGTSTGHRVATAVPHISMSTRCNCAFCSSNYMLVSSWLTDRGKRRSFGRLHIFGITVHFYGTKRFRLCEHSVVSIAYEDICLPLLLQQTHLPLCF